MSARSPPVASTSPSRYVGGEGGGEGGREGYIYIYIYIYIYTYPPKFSGGKGRKEVKEVVGGEFLREGGREGGRGGAREGGREGG